jgi:site-specific recombinase XerD
VALAVVRDLSSRRTPLTPEQAEAFEMDVLAGFVLARASAGLADSTIQQDVGHLQLVRDCFGRPLWEMQPSDADAYFGKELRDASTALRLARAQSLTTYFAFLELRYKAELHALTGRVVECPIDEVNRPRGSKQIQLRIPPTEPEVETLFAGWRADLVSCRKYAPTARNYTMARLMEKVGLRVNEVCQLDLPDLRWELGRFGKLHVRFGKGSRGSGSRERMTPLINGGDRLLRWYVEDVWGHFGDDHRRHDVPLFPSERHNGDGSSSRLSDDGVRDGLNEAVARHLPAWSGRLTPHVLRHYCASQLYQSGMDLVAVQELLGHRWIATTMRYIHVQRTYVEDAWIAGQNRAAHRLEGLLA